MATMKATRMISIVLPWEDFHSDDDDANRAEREEPEGEERCEDEYWFDVVFHVLLLLLLEWLNEGLDLKKGVADVEVRLLADRVAKSPMLGR